jgi:hypothetical protein
LPKTLYVLGRVRGLGIRRVSAGLEKPSRARASEGKPAGKRV